MPSHFAADLILLHINVSQTDEQAPLPGALSQLLDKIRTGLSRATLFLTVRWAAGEPPLGMVTACLISSTVSWKE